MTTNTNTNTTTTTTETMPVVPVDMTSEGKALTTLHQRREARDRKQFKSDIDGDGFVVRLGKLMVELGELSTLAGNKRISRTWIKAAGVDSIDTARRCECLWFVTNESAAREFIADSANGFNSVGALKLAMDKAAKAAAKASTDTDTDTDTDSETGNAGVLDFATGQSFPLTIDGLAGAIIALAALDSAGPVAILSELVEVVEDKLANSEAAAA